MKIHHSLASFLSFWLFLSVTGCGSGNSSSEGGGGNGGGGGNTNNPVPTLSGISPGAVVSGTSNTITVTGFDFMGGSTVLINGAPVPTSYINTPEAGTELQAKVPASSVPLPGNYTLTVSNPAPGGGTSAAAPLTAYIPIPANDIVYNPADGLLYASVPSWVESIGNSVVGIDPPTGNILRQIWAGSNPNQLAISTDGTQLFVGLDGASTVAQFNLTSGLIVNQFSFGAAKASYADPSALPYTATALAAVPGQTNSVAVYPSSGQTTIYDSGVPRVNSPVGAWDNGSSGASLTFGASASTLYAMEGGATATLVEFTIGPAGITAGQTFSSNAAGGRIQYDNGFIYQENGVVLNATTGATAGQFAVFSGSLTGGFVPVVSDSALNRAFFVTAYTANSNLADIAVEAFDEKTYANTGSFLLNSAAGFGKTVRWGQNGLAMNDGAGIYILQSPVVQDLSSSPADLSVTIGAPQAANTGSTVTFTAKVQNLGPNAAQNVALALTLDSSYIVNSATSSQGTCGSGSTSTCDLGALANGANATVTVSATPTTAGTFSAVASATSVSYDPKMSNNQATASTVVTGNFHSMVPTVSSISPALVQAGSGDFTLTVNGTGFNANSTVNIGGSAIATTYVSSTQLTANVSGSSIANYGWTPVTVSNAAPGGGTSAVTPLTIFALVNAPVNAIVFDPFSQQIYASVPGSATNIAGNTIVPINPLTATLGTPVPVGNQPTAMAETSDGIYMFVALNGSNSLAQYDLIHQTVAATLPVTYTQYGTTSSVAPTDIAAMPGSDSTVAMAFPNTWGNFGIFDITGNTGSFRPNLVGGNNPIFADAAHVYTGGSTFYRYSVDSSGLTLIDATTLDGGSYTGIALSNGLVYGAGGGIINPASNPPSLIATLPFFRNAGPGMVLEPEGVLPDASTQKDFLLAENDANPDNSYPFDLERYDTVSYQAEAGLTLPSNLPPAGTGNLLRWGQDGIALLVSASNSTSSQSTNMVMLLRGPFVTPQLLQTDSVASLTSSSVSSLTHGTGNTMLTLTGTNFLPGMAVSWNGSYRTTTLINSTTATVAIPASDLANAGIGSLVATNPGAAASNTLTITIN